MKSLFKWFLRDDSLARLTWFTGVYDISDFKEADQLLFEFLTYCSNFGIKVKRPYLSAFLSTDGLEVVKKNNIKTTSMVSYNYEDPGSLQEGFRVISHECMELFDLYSQEVIEDDGEFKVDMLAWMDKQKKEKIQKSMMENFKDLNSGVGVDGIVDSMQQSLLEVSDKYDKDLLQDLDDLEGRRVKDGRFIQSYVSKFGIEIVDEDTGGGYTGQVWSIAAQPGSGKTRIATINGAYRCAVVEKKGALIDELELSRTQVENILLSFHISTMFKVKIPDKALNRYDELDDAQKRYRDAAYDDLFESGKYGRIVIRAGRDLFVERMRQEMRNFFKINKDIKLWVIDYMGYLSSKPSNPRMPELGKADRIEKGYDAAHRIALGSDVWVICVNQYNKEGNDAAKAGKPISTGFIEGGQSVERYTDYHLNMSMTDAQKASGIRTLSTGKVRAATGFFGAVLQTDLAISVFRQVKRDTSGGRDGGK